MSMEDYLTIGYETKAGRIILIINLLVCLIEIALLGRSIIMATKTYRRKAEIEIKLIIYLLYGGMLFALSKSINIALHFYIEDTRHASYWIDEEFIIVGLGVSISFAVIISFCAKAQSMNQESIFVKHFRLTQFLGIAIPLIGSTCYMVLRYCESHSQKQILLATLVLQFISLAIYPLMGIAVTGYNYYFIIRTIGGPNQISQIAREVHKLLLFPLIMFGCLGVSSLLVLIYVVYLLLAHPNFDGNQINAVEQPTIIQAVCLLLFSLQGILDSIVYGRHFSKGYRCSQPDSLLSSTLSDEESWGKDSLKLRSRFSTDLQSVNS